MFLLDERVFVSLGILKVAAELEQHGHAVSVLDLSGVANCEVALHAFQADAEIKVLGITATTPQLPAVAVIAGAVRAARPDVRIVLGGPHVTLTYSALKLERKAGRENGRAAVSARRLEAMVDVLCTGDGELAILRAIQPDAPKLIDGDDMAGVISSTTRPMNRRPAPMTDLSRQSGRRESIATDR